MVLAPKKSFEIFRDFARFLDFSDFEFSISLKRFDLESEGGFGNAAKRRRWRARRKMRPRSAPHLSGCRTQTMTTHQRYGTERLQLGNRKRVRRTFFFRKKKTKVVAFRLKKKNIDLS